MKYAVVVATLVLAAMLLHTEATTIDLARRSERAKVLGAAAAPGDKEAKKVSGAANRATNAIKNAATVWEAIPQTSHWNASAQHCEDKKMRLCRREDICLKGKGDKPKMGVISGDMWVPVSNKRNEWLYVGSKVAKRRCQLHSEAYGKVPAWGKTKKKLSQRGKVACCKNNFDVLARTGVTWNDAKKHCEDKKQRLCTVAEYCPSGVGHMPEGGVRYHAVWAPVHDKEGDWVAIGQRVPHSFLCKKFSDITGHPPKWGNTKKKTPWRGSVKCCKEHFITRKQKTTWKDAENLCKTKKMRLCTQNEYCPGGKGKYPRGGPRPGEAWAPIKDAENEWIYVGIGKPPNNCKTHTELEKSKPAWGMKDGYAIGHIQCCPAAKTDNGESSSEEGEMSEGASIEKENSDEGTKAPSKPATVASAEPSTEASGAAKKEHAEHSAAGGSKESAAEESAAASKPAESSGAAKAAQERAEAQKKLAAELEKKKQREEHSKNDEKAWKRMYEARRKKVREEYIKSVKKGYADTVRHELYKTELARKRANSVIKEAQLLKARRDEVVRTGTEAPYLPKAQEQDEKPGGRSRGSMHNQCCFSPCCKGELERSSGTVVGGKPDAMDQPVPNLFGTSSATMLLEMQAGELAMECDSFNFMECDCMNMSCNK